MKNIGLGVIALLLCASILLAVPASAKYTQVINKQNVVWSKLIEVRSPREPFETYYAASNRTAAPANTDPVVYDVANWLQVVEGENEGWYFIYLQGGMGGFGRNENRASDGGMGGQVWGYVYLKPGNYFLRAGSNGHTGRVNQNAWVYGGGCPTSSDGGGGGGATMILNNSVNPTVSNVIAIAGGGGGGSRGWADRQYEFGGGGGRLGRSSTDYQHLELIPVPPATAGNTQPGWYGWGGRGGSTNQVGQSGGAHPYTGGSDTDDTNFGRNANPYNAQPWSVKWPEGYYLMHRNHASYNTSVAHNGHGGTHTLTGTNAGSQGTSAGGSNGSLFTGGGVSGSWAGAGGGGYYGGGGGGQESTSGRNDGGGGGGSSYLRNDNEFESFLFGDPLVPSGIDTYVKDVVRRHVGMIGAYANGWGNWPNTYRMGTYRDYVPQIIMLYIGPNDPRTTSYTVH